MGLSFAPPGSQPDPLPAGAVTKTREGSREGRRLGARGCPRTRCPGCSARPPPPLRLPAPPGSVRRAGGGGRGEGGRRGLQTDSSSRRRGAEPDSPLSARTRKLFPSDPPTPPPAPRTAQPRRPPPLAHALGGAPASLSRLGRSVFQGAFKCQRRPWAEPAKPAAAPQVCGPASAGLPGTAAPGRECGAGAEDQPELLERSGALGPGPKDCPRPLLPLLLQPPYVCPTAVRTP